MKSLSWVEVRRLGVPVLWNESFIWGASDDQSGSVAAPVEEKGIRSWEKVFDPGRGNQILGERIRSWEWALDPRKGHQMAIIISLTQTYPGPERVGDQILSS